MAEHVPVFLDEVIALMNVRPAGTYIDATFGRGGHSRALLAALGDDGTVIAFDRDPEAVAVGAALAQEDSRFRMVHTPFSNIAAQGRALGRPVDGILFDLGVSSPQIDTASRGFSFRADGPLDMRMDPAAGESVAAWLGRASEKEISDVLWQYGEERRSRHIAHRIVTERATKPLATTAELAELVRRCVRSHGSRIDPATRTFQALRIFINDELGELERALKPAVELLALKGRLLVIAFHSLEDRLVKRSFRDLDRARRDAEKSATELAPAYALIQRKAVQADADECARNPRARSARLRALERVA